VRQRLGEHGSTECIIKQAFLKLCRRRRAYADGPARAANILSQMTGSGFLVIPSGPMTAEC
jgi:hypothetical protein